MADFKRSLAVVIGINEYQDYPKLQTARYDAERLAEILAIEHKYDYVILAADETYKEYRQGQELPVKNKYQPTLNGLLDLLGKRLPAEINPTQEDRLLFYFAGHGIPDDSDEGPKGYLVPLDADSKKRDSLLPMQELYKRLAALNCRHFLVVLDCCFAGRFSWSSTRKGRTFPKVIHKEHYDRFINSPAWQAITSASHDQEAFDILLGDDNRGTVVGTNHSPFAEGLFKALQGEADVIPAGKNGQPAGDGVITATELYLYLRDHVEIGSKERQTPGLWSLPKHERGEYIFLVPGANPKLKPAPNVNEKNNPYRGLESFDEEHSRFFFGREELIQQLSEQISAPQQPLTVVLGVSGSGKSSLVKAGLIPCLKNPSKSEETQSNLVNTVHQWRILNPMRPGEHPFTALAKTILALADVTGRNQSDTLNFLNVSTRLDNLTFIAEILKQKVNELDRKLAESSFENGEESAETLRLKKELEKFISIAKGWNQSTQKAKQLLIVEHFEELYALCQNPAEQQQLQQVVSDCLNLLSSRLQSDPNQLIDIVREWSQKNPGVRLLLMIDQFEELITLSQRKQKDKQNNQQQQRKKFWNWLTQIVQQPNKQEEWQQFLSLLEKTLSANLDQLRILVTLRSDFEPRFLNSDGLKSYWAKARFPVRAMRSDELRQAIERPAAEMALYFEPPNLVDKLIDEVGQMPGALPLLSFTLSELYIKLAQKWIDGETSDRALTLDADFDTEGGVAGSLTRRANQEYDDLLDDDKRATLRRVMLRMVTFESGESSRRRVPLSELVYADAAENERVKLVLERFNHARLIVSGQETGEPYVEPAHDFLVRSWDKLQEWQQDEQEDLPLQRRLTPAALEWKSKQEARFLWNADPYLDVLKQVLTDEKDNWFNQVETEFVQKSVWRRRRNTNLRWGIASAVILFLSGLTFWALREQRNAVINQMRSARESSEAGLRTSNLTLDTLIQSLQAGKSSKNWLLQLAPPDPRLQNQLVATLRRAIFLNREQQRWQLPQGEVVQGTLVSQDGKLLIATTINEGTICVRDLNSESRQKPCKELPENLRVTDAEFSPDGTKLALMGQIRGSENNEQFPGIYLWDLINNQIYESPRLPGGVNRVSFSPTISFSPTNSKELAFISYNQDYLGVAYFWNWENNQLYPLTNIQVNVQGISFKSDGNLLVATTTKDDNKTVSLWNYNFNEFKKVKQFELGNASNDYIIAYSAAISPNGEELVIGFLPSSESAVIYGQLWSWSDEENPVSRDLGVSIKAKYSPDGYQIAVADSDNTIRLPRYGFQVQELKGHQGDISSLSFSPDGRKLLTSGNDNTIRLWNNPEMVQMSSLSRRKLPSSVQTLSFSSDGKQLATLEDNQINLWDSSSIQRLKEFPQKYSPESKLIFHPKGKQLAIVEPNAIRLLNLRSGQEELTLPGEYGSVSSLSFNSDGTKLAILEGSRTLRVLDLKSKQELKDKHDCGYGDSFPESVTWKFNAKEDQLLVATSGTGGTVQTWDFFSCKQQASSDIERLVGHSGLIDFSFSDNGTSVFFRGEGASMIWWDLQSNQSISFDVDFPGSDLRISSKISPNGRVIISPDGRVIATIDEKGQAILWQLGGLDELLKRGCERVRGYLKNNPNIEESDRRLCDNIPPSTPSQQTDRSQSQ